MYGRNCISVNERTGVKQTAVQVFGVQQSQTEPRENAQSRLFHTNQLTCMPVCVFPDTDNQHISVTEMAADHEGIGPWFRPRSPDKI